MRKLIVCLTALILAAHCLPAARAWDTDDVQAESAIVMHESGRIVYEKDADKRMLIASTTKLMTALVAAERCEAGRLFTAKPEDCAVEGSSMYLVPGERYSLEQLLQGLLLASGNDAALTLARGLAGSPELFACWMNDKAGELEMDNSHFVNPHGLDAPEHYSSAADLAKLMSACMQNETVSGILGMKSASVEGQTYQNHNKLLWSCPGCTGGKTGYTQAAGRCLVSCCEREGTRLVCVTLNDPSDWEDHCRLYDLAFSRYSVRNITEGIRFSVPVISGDQDLVFAEPEELELFLPRDAALRLEADLPWFVFAPVNEGDRLGTLQAYEGEHFLGELPIRCTDSVAVQLWNAGQEEVDGRTIAETDLGGGVDVTPRSRGSHTVRESTGKRLLRQAG